MLLFQQLQRVSNQEIAAEQPFIRDYQLLHLPGLFYLSHCQFEAPQFCSELFDAMQIRQHRVIAESVNKRKAEFLAGRYAAKLILEQMGWQGYQVGVGSDRCPVWPNGVVGSISHNHNQAICVVSDELDYLGVDIENILLAGTALSVEQTVATTSEVALLMQQGISHAQAVSLIFSAKESLFKAIYPRVGRYLEFDSSQVLAVDIGQQTLQLQLRDELRGEIYRQQDFTCHFELQAQQVTTLVYA